MRAAVSQGFQDTFGQNNQDCHLVKTAILILVEMRGIEPLSESTLTKTSPGADGNLHSLTEAHAVMLIGSVASSFMICAKLSIFTCTTSRRPVPSRGPLRRDAHCLSSEENSVIVVL